LPGQVKVAPLLEGPGQVEAGLGKPRVCLQGLLVKGHGFLQPAFLLQQVGQVEVGLHMLRVGLQGPTVMHFGPLWKAPAVENVSQVYQGVRVVGPDGQNGSVFFSGFLPGPLAFAVQGLEKQSPGIGSGQRDDPAGLPGKIQMELALRSEPPLLAGHRYDAPAGGGKTHLGQGRGDIRMALLQLFHAGSEMPQGHALMPQVLDGPQRHQPLKVIAQPPPGTAPAGHQTQAGPVPDPGIGDAHQPGYFLGAEVLLHLSSLLNTGARKRP